VGARANLVCRVREHREAVVPGFTREYGVHRLVWYEEHSELASALRRESNLKHGKREWKVALIVQQNPAWRDLWEEITR
jgi:putative endonuclease